MMYVHNSTMKNKDLVILGILILSCYNFNWVYGPNAFFHLCIVGEVLPHTLLLFQSKYHQGTVTLQSVMCKVNMCNVNKHIFKNLK